MTSLFSGSAIVWESLRNPEIDLLGLFIPWAMIIAVPGFLLAWLTVLILEKLRWTTFIWHLPLFFVGLCLFFTFALGLLFTP
jgi:hypothetical protein